MAKARYQDFLSSVLLVLTLLLAPCLVSAQTVSISSISLSETSVSLIPSETWQLTYSYQPSNANSYTFAWSTSNSAVVTVTTTGKLTARAAGQATVTLRDTRTDVSASCVVSVTNDVGQQSSLLINEIQVANLDQYIDPANCYGGWVELYNPTEKSIRMFGLYVSDEADNPKKFGLNTAAPVVHARSCRNIWFDHNSRDGQYGYNGNGATNQVPFKLNPEGGTIYISDSNGNLIASQSYPAAVARCSWARLTDGSSSWGMTALPTPEANNDGKGFATTRLDAPQLSSQGGVFASGRTQSFTASCPSGATLIWTTDGSTPTLTNGNKSTQSTVRFTVSSTTVYRFALFRDGYLPSQVVTRSFIFKNHDYYLPIISIATHPDNMFSPQHGAIVKGTAGLPGNGRTDANYNWNMSWERPVNIEYLVPSENQDGTFIPVLNQECDFEVCGGWTRSMYGGQSCTIDGKTWEATSSFRLKGNKAYEGVNHLDYPIFPQKPFNRYKVWQVRNGGNDMNRIKDAALAQMVLRSGFYVDAQDYQPAHIFINGMYYGMHNIRESNNFHYAYSNYGIDSDDIDQFDLGQQQYNQKAGDNVVWKNLLETAKLFSVMPNQTLLDRIHSMLDVDEFINYMALECFLGSDDWLTNVNNTKGFRSRTDGKYHFVFFDCDQGYRVSDMAHKLMTNNYTAEVDDLFRYLMAYKPFKEQFATAFQIVNASVLYPGHVTPIVQEMYSRASRAMGFESKYSSTSVASEAQSAYNGARVSNLSADGFVSGSQYQLSLTANVPAAHLLLNGQEIPYQTYIGAAYAPINLTAKAPVGYTFQGWKTVSQSSGAEVELVPWAGTWRYNQTSDLSSVAWTSPGYTMTAASWKTGQAPMGFASSGKFMLTSANTVLTKGRRTYYFRNTFTLDEDPSPDDIFYVYYKVDDGIRVHINGTDIGGYHCPQGATYSTFSTAYEGDTPYESFLLIPVSLLHKGTNVIACDVHNTSDTSSDIYFDARVVMLKAAEPSFLSTDETFCLSDQGAGKYTLEAVFKKVDDARQLLSLGASPVRINEVSASNDIHINEYDLRNDWIELYNTTNAPVDVQGMILTGNTRSQRYEIPAPAGVSTVIPAGGTLVVWCDELASASQLHVPLKLDNSDGSSISIQAADGAWEDRMTYMEQPRWYTYGRYPDGGIYEGLLPQPTIQQSNRLGTYDFLGADPSDWTDTDVSITLSLAKGWNWISHNMQDDVERTRLTAYAQYLKSQRQDIYRDSKLGWIGTLSMLSPQHAYKVQMLSDADITLRGALYDTQRSVHLDAGWNWIGFPLINATNLTTALRDYVPGEGDQIIGLDQMATYSDGQWIGTLTSLTPGQGYMLHSATSQDFQWNSLAQSRHGSRRYAPAQAQHNAPWTLDIHQYPNVMGLIASLRIDDMPVTDGIYSIGAFAGDECRGIATLTDGLLFMNIHGEGGEQLHFRLRDAEGNEYVLEQRPEMAHLTTLGTARAPYILSLHTDDATGIEPPSISPDAQTVYYNLNGQRLSAPQGICIRQTIYPGGHSTRKIVK